MRTWKWSVLAVLVVAAVLLLCFGGDLVPAFAPATPTPTPTPVPTATPTPTPTPIPRPDVTLSAGEATPGEWVVLTLYSTDFTDIELTTTLSCTPELLPDGDKMTAIIPVPYFDEPGEYSISLRVENWHWYFSVTALERDYPIQEMTISQETAEQTALNQEARRQFAELITPLMSTYTPERYFDGPLVQPVESYKRISTWFPTRRYTNGAADYVWHEGMDYASPSGTPVYAAAGGVVVLAQEVTLTGNTIVIDHGLGVLSYYYHLNTIDIEAGAVVEAGQTIATVGTTGYSTGPHLHFGLSAGGVYVDPVRAMEEGFVNTP